MTTFDLYFVGYRKHDAIQHLTDGPFIDWDDARHAREKHFSPENYCIVVATMTPTRLEAVS
jgi:hypothetical protein